MGKELSFEFFPPKTKQGLQNLITTANTFNALNPEYFSVTFGAGGSVQEKTLDTCVSLVRETKIPVCPHLSCIGTKKENIKNLLEQYIAQGIRKLLVLRGDLPVGSTVQGDFDFANELVSWIRKEYGDLFHISVACYPEIHPQSKNAQTDFEYFCRKVDAGADSAITQYFYNVDSFAHFLDLCQQKNIQIPIVPGIMPITNYHQLSRFSSICGAEIPRWIRKHLESISDDPSAMFDFGADVVTQLCSDLMDKGATGLHFYTLNQSKATLEICDRLNMSPKRRARLSST